MPTSPKHEPSAGPASRPAAEIRAEDAEMASLLKSRATRHAAQNKASATEVKELTQRENAIRAMQATAAKNKES